MNEELVLVVEVVMLLDRLPFDTVVMGLESIWDLRGSASPKSSMDRIGVG